MKTLLTALLLLLTLIVNSDEWLGKKVPLLVLTDGTTYKEVTFKAIEPADITITHTAGISLISMAELPPEAQAALGFDSKKIVTAEPVPAPTPKQGWVRHATLVYSLPDLSGEPVARLIQRGAISVVDLGDISVEVEMITATLRDAVTYEFILDGPNRPIKGFIDRENFSDVLPSLW